MGKSGDLWDDSALIKAFDGAISKYKKMHGMCGVTEGEMVDSITEENLPTAEADNGSNGLCSNTEHVKNDDNNYTDVETTAKIGETANDLHLLQIQKNPPSEFDSSKHVDSSNSQTGNIAPTGENHVVESGPPQSQNDAAWHSMGQEEYSQLLNKYYEIEDQRQKVLHQLNQYSNWNYQNPVSDVSTSEEYQVSLPQPYDTVTCYCSYGCQNWVVPCNSLPASCCDDVSKDAQKGQTMSPEESGIVKIAMDAAKRAVSSITQDASNTADVSVNEGEMTIPGKYNELGMGIAQSTESSKPDTDLAAVLNAWYSAGFYTGKYLSEQQSVEKRKHGKGL